MQGTAYHDCEVLRVQGISHTGTRTFLLPFDRPRRIEQQRLRVVSARAWMHGFEQLSADAYPYGGLRHVPDTIDLLPYQLEPVLAVLRHGYTRLLIADDVGTGKTIEAGLLLRELAERFDGFRGLILVPAGLRQQWADELASRFGITPIAADAFWLRSVARELPSDVNPWSPPGTYLASFDFIKRPECLHALEDVRWNLLVVDEAHAATLSTDRRAAIDAIARRSRTIALLTATPPLDPAEFAALCGVGEFTGEPPIVLFQRRRSGGGSPARRSVVLPVRLTDDERRLHRLLERYTSLVWREARRLDSGNARLVTMVLRKRALSSSSSLDASLRRRHRLVASMESPLEHQLLLPLDDGEEDAREDVVPDDVLGAPAFADAAVEGRWIGRLIEAATAAARRESKAGALVRLLRRIRQPAIVFTEYRDTLENLRERLSAANLPVCVLHGGLSANERRHTLREFASGQKTLLATDAAAEGLNLQWTCRVIVHFELPWNPARLLQRAGRVDRIGQQRPVHEIALVAADTAESLVITPLARRVAGWSDPNRAERLFELLTERRVAEAVFEGVPPEPSHDVAPAARCVRVDLADEARTESLRLERSRSLIRRRALPRRRGQPCVPVTLVRRSLPQGIMLVFEQKTSIGQGRVVACSLVAIHVGTTRDHWPRRPREIRARLSLLLPHLRRAIAPTLDALGSSQLNAVAALVREPQSRARFRSEAIQRERNSAARHLVQAGLFEWRGHRSTSTRSSVSDDFVHIDEVGPGGASDALLSSTDLRAVLIAERA